MEEKQHGTLSALSAGARENLQQALEQTYEMVTRDYLCELDNPDQYELCPPSFQALDLDLTESSLFFRLDRLVLNRPESFLEHLSVLSVASIVEGSVAAVFHSDGHEKTFYLGVISKQFRGQTWASRRQSILKAMSGALEGNLPGSVFPRLKVRNVSPTCCPAPPRGLFVRSAEFLHSEMIWSKRSISRD